MDIETKKIHRMSIKETEAIDFSEEMTTEEKEQLKRSVLEKMQKELNKKQHNKRYQWKTWKMAAAAATAAIIIPSGVFAADKIAQYFHSEVKTNGYQVDMKIEKEHVSESIETANKQENNNTSLEAETVTKAQPVILECEMPKDYTMKEEKGEGWYDFCHKQGFDAGKEFSVELIQVDRTEDKKFRLDDIGTQEEIKINENNGVYAKFNGIVGSRYTKETEPTSYTQRVVVFYEKQGYILQVYAMGGIKKETLLEYISGITLNPCEKGKESSSILLSDYIKYSEPEYSTALRTIAAKHVVPQNKAVLFNGIEYEVKQVQVSDTLETIIKDAGKGMSDSANIWKRRLEYSDKNGKLKTYTRETIENGNGRTTPCSRVVGTKDVAQKFVLVELRVKNTTKEMKKDIQVCLDMNYMSEKNGAYVFDTASYCRPKAVEDCQLDQLPQYFRETDGGKGFYLKDLEAGQEEVCHIGYFVDEDYLDKMFLEIDGGCSYTEGQEYEGTQIDIRQ